MRKYLVATFVACLGVLGMNAQENKSVELNQCKTNSHVTVEGHTVTSTGYGMLELPKNDYSNYTGINFDLSNFKKLEENSTNSTVALKVEYLIVSNGKMHYCCHVNYKDQSYLFLEDIPDYDSILSHTNEKTE